MSRLILTRIAWVVVGLVVIATAVFAVSPIMSGPEDLDLGPVVHNTHAPVPTPTESETPEPETEAETASPTSQPVQPAPPVVVEDYDDDWDDDDWDDDDDDWDDDDDDWDDDDD